MNIKIEIDDPSLSTHLVVIFARDDVKKVIVNLRKTYINEDSSDSFDEWKQSKGIFFEYGKDLYDALEELQLPPYLDNAFMEAVVTGRVTSFMRSFPIVIPNYVLKWLISLGSEHLMDGNYSYALLSPPEATKKEILNAHRLQQNNIKESKITPETFIPDGTPLLQPMTDTISNISRDVEWYLMHESGMSYSQIAQKSGSGINKDTVRKAVKQFEKKIKTSK